MTETETANAKAEDKPDAISCTFCAKATGEIETMVAGPGVFICNECVALCVELIESKPKNPDTSPTLPSWKMRLTDDELLSTLPRIATAGLQVERQLAEGVIELRARGYTWTKIGGALGMTRQSAWERFSGEE